MLQLGRRLVLTVLLGGLLCALLVRFAPGFDVDEDQLDTRRSDRSRQKLREERRANSDVLTFYGHFMNRYAHGDLGESSLLHRPVAQLLQERAAPTVAAVAGGLFMGWATALAVALATIAVRSPLVETGAAIPGAALLCTPAALIALLLFAMGARGAFASAVAVALLLYPRIVHFMRNILREAYSAPFVRAARARGVRVSRILLRHILPACGPQLLSLTGVSVSLALSGVIPMEMVLDVPGLGQLAWQAALGRDLNLLVHIMLFLSLAVTAANLTADLAGGTAGPGGAA